MRYLLSAVWAVLAVAVGISSSSTGAQTFPTRTIHLVVTYAPGGTGDIVARLLSERLANALGQNVVVENRPGASGAIGTQSVASATPDGHTLLLGQPAEVAINPHWIRGLPYDPDRDLQPVALVTVVPLALVVPADATYSTVAEMVAVAQKIPLTFASAGTGTPGHLAGELLKLRTHANMTHVPYKGAGPALNDLLGGHVDFFFSGFPAAFAQVKAGSLRLLAVSTAKRSPAAPAGADRCRDARTCGLRHRSMARDIRSARHPEGRRQPAQYGDQSYRSPGGFAGEAARRRSRCAHNVG